MGSCLSLCFPSSSTSSRNHNSTSEQTPLLQDPSLILHQPPRHQISAVESPDEAQLERILDRTSSGLIDIKATHDGESMTRMKYLIDRLQLKPSQDSLIIHRPISSTSLPQQAEVEEEGAEGNAKKYSTMHKITMRPSKEPITPKETELLEETVERLQDALRKVTTRQKVDDVVVKLRWD